MLVFEENIDSVRLLLATLDVILMENVKPYYVCFVCRPNTRTNFAESPMVGNKCMMLSVQENEVKSHNASKILNLNIINKLHKDVRHPNPRGTINYLNYPSTSQRSTENQFENNNVPHT